MAGTTRVVQSAGPSGFLVSYTRKVFRGPKLRRNERYVWRYKPENAIVEVGPPPTPRAAAKKKPPPPPAPPEEEAGAGAPATGGRTSPTRGPKVSTMRRPSIEAFCSTTAASPSARMTWSSIA